MKLNVNGTNALRLLADAFTGRTTFIGELMQNARRAGATYINFRIGKNTLVATDDGCGVSDLSKLLTLCESGWGEAVDAAEHPYGVGFLSAIMASTYFEVHSKNQMLMANTADLLAGKPADILSMITAISGTSIDLQLPETIVREIADVIRRFSIGFPIHVVVDGVVMPQRLSIGSAKYLEKIPGIGTLVWNGDVTNTYTACMLQGLPINFVDHNFLAHSAFGLHLDKSFKGRMPDRAQVIDARFEGIAPQVEAAQLRIATRMLRKDSAPGLDKYKWISRNWPDLIDMVTEIPPGVFLEIDGDVEIIPINGHELSDLYSECDATVLKDNCSDFTYAIHPTDYANDFVAIMRILGIHGLPTSSFRLPYWVRNRELAYSYIKAVPLDSNDAPIVDATEHRLILPNQNITVVMCASVRLELYNKDDELLLTSVEDTYCPFVGDILYMVDNNLNKCHYYFFKQDMSRTEWDDEWDDAAICDDWYKFPSELQLALNGDVATIIKRAMGEIARSELYGRKFIITFADVRNLTVEEITNACQPPLAPPVQ